MVKVLFAHKSHPIEPLGVGYISGAIARGGHKSKMILTYDDMEDAVQRVSSAIESEKPAIFAQSIIFGSHGYAIELNKRIKEKYPKIISVLGGPAATFTPELMDRGFDVICRYEGEDPFLEFCNALEKGEDVGNIPNLWVRENPNLYKTEIKKTKEILDIDNPGYKDDSGFDPGRKRFVNATRTLLQDSALNELPFPDRDILYEHKIFRDGPIKHFMHTRGCAWDCAYCFNVIQNMENKGKGKAVRFRTHKSVVDEILEVKNKYPLELVYFQDDVFGPAYNIKFAKAFAEEFKKVGLPFHCHIRYNLVTDEIAKALADAGCTGVHVAIEAGNEDIRNVVHRRRMTTEQIRNGAAALRKYGIKQMTQNILGAPGETKEEMFETLQLNIDVKPFFASASIFQPYPGTKALEYARDVGALPQKGLNELVDTFGLESFYDKSILALDPKHKRWLEVFQKFFAIAVQNPEIYTSGKLNEMMKPFLDSEDKDEELKKMYRQHRAGVDEVLYGVKLEEVVAI
jgi:anaerobic magnesium-protoporphyrin IX monomethyl ester cyclase